MKIQSISKNSAKNQYAARDYWLNHLGDVPVTCDGDITPPCCASLCEHARGFTLESVFRTF